MTRTDLLLCARLSSIAYEINPDLIAQRVEALGLNFVAQLTNGERQAIVVEDNDRITVAWRGTPVMEHTSPAEIINDLDCRPLDLGPLGRVHHGAWQSMAALVPAILRVTKQVDRCTGHSLGGASAELSKALFPEAEICSFGAFKCADEDFWDSYGGRGPTAVVHAHDFAAEYPLLNLHGWRRPPGAFLWLHEGKMVEATDRPGLDCSVGDHDIDAGYIAALEALASMVPA